MSEVFAQPSIATIAVAGVDADGDLVWINPRRLTHEIRIAHRRSSDDDPGHAALEPTADRFHVANSAAQLEPHRKPRQNALNGLGVHRLAGERAIEIDDMQIVEPLLDER